MLKPYHRRITIQAFGEPFSCRALAVIVRANLGQDRLRLQVSHPEFHFYGNTFAEGQAYIERQRALIAPALASGEVEFAWQAFGRLTHAAQDIYSHSNYVTLWLDRFARSDWPPPEEVDPSDPEILSSLELRSGKVYYLLEVISFPPGLKQLVNPWLPHDSHAWINLDAPWCGPKFAYGFAAAVKRTRQEFEQTKRGLTPELLVRFTDSSCS